MRKHQYDSKKFLVIGKNTHKTVKKFLVIGCHMVTKMSLQFPRNDQVLFVDELIFWEIAAGDVARDVAGIVGGWAVF